MGGPEAPCPACGADLGIRVGFHEVAAFTAVLMPPEFPCPNASCGAVWTLAEEADRTARKVGALLITRVDAGA